MTAGLNPTAGRSNAVFALQLLSYNRNSVQALSMIHCSHGYTSRDIGSRKGQKSLLVRRRLLTFVSVVRFMPSALRRYCVVVPFTISVRNTTPPVRNINCTVQDAQPRGHTSDYSEDYICSLHAGPCFWPARRQSQWHPDS